MLNRFVFLQLVVVGISVWGTNGFNKEEETAMFEILRPIIMDCMKECGLKPDGKKSKEGEKCLQKCVIKALGVLTDDGKYNIDAVKETISAVTANEETAKKYQAVLENCLKDRDVDIENEKEEAKKIDIIYECFEQVQKS